MPERCENYFTLMTQLKAFQIFFNRKVESKENKFEFLEMKMEVQHAKKLLRQMLAYVQNKYLFKMARKIFEKVSQMLKILKI